MERTSQIRLAACVALSSLFLLSSCAKSEIPEFDPAFDSVRFPLRTAENSEPAGYNDVDRLFVLSHSFVLTPDAPSAEVELPVMLIGKASSADRQISAVPAEGSTAVQGTDFEILDARIPAGAIQGAIKLKLINSDRLTKEDLRLYLQLEASDDFQKAPADFARALILFGRSVPAPTFPDHIETYNKLIAGTPNARSSSMDYYSPAAMMAIVQALKWTDWDDQEKWGTDYNGENYGSYKYLPRYSYITRGDRYKAFVLTIKDYIAQYNVEHPGAPLVHDAGLLKGSPVEVRE